MLNVILSFCHFTASADGPLHNELGEETQSLQLFGEYGSVDKAGQTDRPATTMSLRDEETGS